MKRGWCVLVACFLVAERSFVNTASFNRDPESRGEALFRSEQGVDENVEELHQLKPNDNSVAVMKTHSVVLTNINGKKQQHENRKEEVEKNGEVVARVEQEMDKDGQNQEPHVKTLLDIPSRNLHKVIEHGPKPAERIGERMPSPLRDNLAHQYRNYAGTQYSPLDMAEYVFWTGDERGATSAIEEFLEDGQMSREEAILFLEEIKQNLEILKSQYAAESEHPRVQLVSQRDNFPGALELSEIRQQMRENLRKKSSDYPDPQLAVNDEDYEEIVERLKMGDAMYNEYSLEEVIYQLAKIMFRQSLSRGSAEAQEALRKFTDFLESEAQQGRIPRSLEKKVLDVVIASLSDTLTQHPELVPVARQSLGLLDPHQYNSKQGAAEGQNGIPVEASHRFQSGKNLPQSGSHKQIKG